MSPVKVCCFILLICFICAGPYFFKARAQQPDFIHYNTSNAALPHDVCYELMLDKTGYLWVGTDNGLARFDGRDMKIYRQCFRSPFVTVTAEYDTTFLIAAWTGGIYRLSHDSVKELYSTDPGWTESANDLLLYRDIVLVYHFNNPNYFRLSNSGDTLMPARFFIAGANGRLTLLEGGYTPVPAFGLKYGILNDQLIAYGDSGVFRLEDSVFRQVSAQPFDHLAESGAGGVYGFHNGCLYTLSADLRTYQRLYDLRSVIGMPGLRASAFLVLPSGNLVLRLSHSIFERSVIVQQLYINTHTLRKTDLAQLLGIDVFISDCIADRENGFWVGTDGSGVYHVFEPKFRRYGNGGEFKNPTVIAMMQCGPEQVYIGTKKGVYLLKDEQLQLVYPDIYARKFFWYRDSSIMMQAYDNNNLQLKGYTARKTTNNTFCTATAHYIVEEIPGEHVITGRQNGKRMECITHGLPADFRCVCEDADGCVWHGTDHGLYWWHKGDTASVTYSNPVLAAIRINQLAPDSSGNLWVATAGAGLYCLQHGKIVVACNEQNGLSNTLITALLLHGNKVWIGTPNGLNVLDRHTGRVSVYKQYDGLIAADVTALAAFSDSEVVVGSSKGITVFHSNTQEALVSEPQLTLEQVMVDDRAIDAYMPITAGYRSRITLTYNVVSFAYPELVHFQYRLSDSDTWIETANKSIVLTNLAPGLYRLQVRARRYNSGWSKPLVLALDIQKPWWRKTVFYCLAGVLIIFCIYILLRSHIAKTHKKLLHRQQFAELKLKALQAQLNPHFVSNALSAVQFFTLVQDEMSANNYLSRFAGLTRLLLESSRSRFVPLKDELQIITHYFELEKLRFKNRFVYEVKVDDNIDIEKELLPGVLLQPFVENSINHGIVYLPEKVQGSVVVHIGRHNEMLLIEITDNGIGRHKAKEIQQQSHRVHKSRSAEIIAEISQSVNNLEGCHLHISVTDLTDDHGNAAGTSVHISCLIANKYKPHYANSDY